MQLINGKFLKIIIIIAGLFLLFIFKTPKILFNKFNQLINLQPSLAFEIIETPIKVKTKRLTIKDVELDFRYPARISGYREVAVKSQISGLLLSKHYQEGQFIRQGDILFNIDPIPWYLNIKKITAQLEGANFELEQNELSLIRAAKLIKTMAISRQEYEKNLAAYQKSAATLKELKLQLAIAMVDLGHTNIRAPISGIASRQLHSDGSLIQTSENLAITNIIQLNPVYANFSYPESDVCYQKKLLQMQKIKSVDIAKLPVIIEDDNQQVITEGEVDFIDSRIDQSTLSITARALVDNHNYQLMPGQFVRIKIKNLVWLNAITIPERAIIQTDKGPMVYIVDENNRVTSRFITLGAALRDNERIVEEGLQSDEQVVVEGIIKLKPNQLVQITNEVSELQ